MNPIGIAIHGGAGTLLESEITTEQRLAYLNALHKAIEPARQILLKGATSLEAVQLAIIELEDCPLFNAGRGSVFNHEGNHEMDASIMEGQNLRAGAVCGIHQIKNPILLARTVMEKTDHVLLSGKGAEQVGKMYGLEFADEEYFFNDFRHKQWLSIKDSDTTALDHSKNPDKKFGTVGAVALDKSGNLAAGTSTGGMTNKKFGRIGDTPIIGSGTYANNKTCAVSCTGHGEYFMKFVAAYDVSCLIEYKGLSLQNACDEVVMNKLKPVGGEGGLISIDTSGNIVFSFNSEGMYRAKALDNRPIESFIFR